MQNFARAGIKSGYVSIKLSTGSHALNIFNTSDRGFIYIDDTGTVSDGLSNCDKIVDVEIGESYIPVSLFPEKEWSSTWQSIGVVTDVLITWDGEWY